MMRVYRIRLAKSLRVIEKDGAFRFATEAFALASSAVAAITALTAKHPEAEVGAVEVLGDGVMPVFIAEEIEVVP